MTFSDTKADNLARALINNDTITELVIKKSKLRKQHIQQICESMGATEALQYLRLENVSLLESAGEAIGKALKENVSLKSLTLVDAVIGDRVMMQIVKGIREAICLEYIELRDNLFEEPGFMGLISAMRVTKACRVLKL